MPIDNRRTEARSARLLGFSTANKIIKDLFNSLYNLTFWVLHCPEPTLPVDWIATPPWGSAHTRLQTIQTDTHTVQVEVKHDLQHGNILQQHLLKTQYYCWSITVLLFIIFAHKHKKNILINRISSEAPNAILRLTGKLVLKHSRSWE